MIYLELFFAFLKIGAFSFGGGYGMISLIRETVLSHAWMAEEELLNFIAVAESTPGPLAVNMATFIGASQAGFWGSLAATFGVVLPSFVVILIIAGLITNLLQYKGVAAFLKGVRPGVVGLILATAVTIGLPTLFSFSTVGDALRPDGAGLLILGALAALHLLSVRLRKKAPSPILMILFSAFLGILLY